MIDTPAIEKHIDDLSVLAGMADNHGWDVEPIAWAITTIRALMEAVEYSERVITGLNRQLNEQFDLTTKLAADRLAERERCAKIAETAHERWAGMETCPVVCDVTACREIAAAIRSKGAA